MTQIFKVNPDGTTTELTTSGQIKDIMQSDECYVLVADNIRKVFLWIGSESNVRSKFIGAKRSQEIRGQVGLHYSTGSVDEGDEPQDLLKIIGGKTEGGIAKEVKEDNAPMGGGVRIPSSATPSAGRTKTRPQRAIPSTQNQGPLYTGETSKTAQFQDEAQLNFEQIMQKLEEIQIPSGYERELVVVGNYAYSVVEKVQTFLGKKQVSKEISRVGSIPEGVFFAENYSPRILTEGGKIMAIEFLKRTGKGSPGRLDPKSKKNILKSQLKEQLG